MEKRKNEKPKPNTHKPVGTVESEYGEYVTTGIKFTVY